LWRGGGAGLCKEARRAARTGVTTALCRLEAFTRTKAEEKLRELFGAFCFFGGWRRATRYAIYAARGAM